MTVRIDIIFDVPADSQYYRPTIDAVSAAAYASAVDLDLRVVRTDTITEHYIDNLPDAVVIGPGTPYSVPAAAELVIRSAREQGVPLVGT